MGTMTDFVTIVSGLPRSGTSLMMQMLQAGGLEVLTDGVRVTDEDNPRGYLEFEPVKHTREDPSWLDGAAGKAVKMVYLLLPTLPSDRSYRVILMVRDLGEVLRSQRVMLDRSGKSGARLTDDKLRAVFQSEYRRIEEWLSGQPNFDVLRVRYHDLIADPDPVVDAIDRFTGPDLDREAMRAVIDPQLYRQRAE